MLRGRESRGLIDLPVCLLLAGSSPHGPSVAARSRSNDFSKPSGQMALIGEADFDGDL